MRRYLDKEDEEVFTIREQDFNASKYIGRVLIGKHGVMIYKEDLRMFLSWEEIDLILEKRREKEA